jgi:hypothetical protein
MTLIPLDIPPGVFRRGTTYQSRGRWRDSNMVRFDGKSVLPFPGWQAISHGEMLGVCRSFHSWADNLGRNYLAIGTTEKLFILTGDDELIDITPAGFTAAPPMPGGLYGYGTSLYGIENYSEPVGDEEEGAQPANVAIRYGYWHLDNWGENLVALCDSDARVFEWVPGTPQALAIVADALPDGNEMPVGAQALVVTDERFLVLCSAELALGTPQPRRVQWSAQEDNTTWIPDPLNAAGEQDLTTAGSIVRAIRFRNETLIFTSVDVHRLSYVGYPVVYTTERIASDCGLIAPTAIAKNTDRVMWLTSRGLFTYDGSSVQPVQSESTSDIEGTAGKHVADTRTAVVAHIELNNEFIILYPDAESRNPTRYLLWNYLSNWWAVGTLDRTAWSEAFLASSPVAAQSAVEQTEAGADKYTTHLFKHGSGTARPSYAHAAFIESGPIDIGSGDQFINAKRIIYDIDPEGMPGFELSLSFRIAPDGPIIKTVSGIALDDPRGYVDLRGTGRSVALTIREEIRDIYSVAWRFGTFRLDAQPGEGR